MKIRVAIADDHPVVRRGLAQMIAAEPDMALAAECRSGADVLALMQCQLPDVLILDIALPDASGIDLLEILQEKAPEMPVLVLSMYPPEQFAARAIRAGASGYLTKESATEELVTAIRTVVGGKRYLTPEAADALAVAVQSSSSNRPSDPQISPREREVLELYVAGRTMTDISELMQISVRTVSTYKTRILEKLNLTSNAELIAWAISKNVVRRPGS